MGFSPDGKEGDDMVKGVEIFKYLERILYQTDDDWSEVRQNIMRTRSVWWRLGTLLRQEGAGPRE